MDINSCNRACHCRDDTKKHHLLKTFKALDEIAQLAPNDFAFVKRTSGEWQPAVVVAVSPTYVYEEKWIKFLLDIDGHTKTIPASKWTKLIRLVHFPVTPMDPEGSFPSLKQTSTAQDASICKDQEPKFKRSASNDTHQRAFMSALASIDLSPRSAKTRAG
jgi:hypothetical protein